MPLSESQEAILRFVELADGEGSVLAHDIAAELGYSPRSMGGRMRALVEKGLLETVLVKARASAWSDPLWAYVLTDEGRAHCASE